MSRKKRPSVTKLLVATMLTFGVTTFTGSYISTLITPMLSLWLLYFIVIYQLLTLYENGRKKRKNKSLKDGDQETKLGCVCGECKCQPLYSKPRGKEGVLSEPSTKESVSQESSGRA